MANIRFDRVYSEFFQVLRVNVVALLQPFSFNFSGSYQINNMESRNYSAYILEAAPESKTLGKNFYLQGDLLATNYGLNKYTFGNSLRCVAK